MMFYQKNQSQKWNEMESNLAAHLLQDILSNAGRKWKIDGVLIEPTVKDIEELVVKMLKDMNNTDYDSVESGGILLKRDQGKIDLYVHLGEISENSSI